MLLQAEHSLVAPAYFSAPEGAYTLGEPVAELCERAGFAADPEQRDALDAIFTYTADHRPAAFEGGICAARQNIKTGAWKQTALGWMFIEEDLRRVVWTSHEFPTTIEAFREMCELVEGSDYLTRRIKQIHRGRGEECIETTKGLRLEFRARMANSGRGLAGPRLILDESLFLIPAHMGSLMPLMSTLSSKPGGAQILYGGSAGKVTSDVWRAIRDRGRIGDPDLFYMEFCDDLGGRCEQPRCLHVFGTPGCRLDEPARWQRANPQMNRRITEDYIRNERRALDPVEFSRERLGWWQDPPETGGPYGDSWSSALDVDSQIVGKLHVALAVANERDAAAIAVAGLRSDDVTHVEVIHHDRGTEWCIGVLRSLREKWGVRKVMLDKQSAAASLITDLEAAGFEVDGLTTAQYAQACGRLHDAVTAALPTVRHIGQADLNTAVNGTTKRTIGDGYGWDRKEGTDITPHDAVTIAAWGVSRPRRGGWAISL